MGLRHPVRSRQVDVSGHGSRLGETKCPQDGLLKERDTASMTREGNA